MKEGQFEILDYEGEEVINCGIDAIITKINFKVRDLQTNVEMQLQVDKHVGMKILRLMIEPPHCSWWRRLLRIHPLKPPLKIKITCIPARLITGVIFHKYCVERI